MYICKIPTATYSLQFQFNLKNVYAYLTILTLLNYFTLLATIIVNAEMTSLVRFKKLCI